MGIFSKGDKVTVTTGDAKGKTGTVSTEDNGPGQLIGVKGIDSKVKEAVLGHRGYDAGDLKKHG